MSDTLISYWWVGEQVPAVPGAAQWLSDVQPVPDMPGQLQRFLYLPPWVPRKINLAAVWVGAACGDAVEVPIGGITELTCWVDPKGHAFSQGDPPGSEATDYMKDIVLYHGFSRDLYISDYVPFPVPITVDRDAGDLIGFTSASSLNLSWVFVGFMMLVPTAVATKIRNAKMKMGASTHKLPPRPTARHLIPLRFDR